MRKQLTPLVAALTMTFLTGAGVLAGEPSGVTSQAQDRLLYRGPSTHSPVITKLAPEAEPSILLCKDIEATEWCKVNYDGIYGWLRAEGSDRPESDADHPAPASGAIRIHRGPSHHSPTIGTLDKGAEARQLLCKRIEGTEWCKVTVNGIYGWIPQ
jgi:SH3-like domain-containing protein